MFDFLRPRDQSDVKGLRDSILQMIKEELQQLAGGEGHGVGVILITVHVADDERFLYESALYQEDPQIFKLEVQRLADDFVLNLPERWQLHTAFETAANKISGAGVKDKVKITLQSKAKVVPSGTDNVAYLKLISDTDHSSMYKLAKDSKRINIGRGESTQANDGSFRINQIAFSTEDQGNHQYVSRRHAHLEWREKEASFLLFADEGGVPPGNKTKIRHAADETIHKLISTHIGYPLAEGDHIILADKIVLAFSWATV